MPLVLDLSSIDATMLETVGGKAANLGELTRAGLPVPQGFCVTTDAYRMISATDGLAGLRPDKARQRILEAAVPGELREAIVAAYAELGDDVPVAVRSSATAEDLPFASFAGQQDTYLNVVGAAAVVEAVRHCWASLWTDRAVSYRETNGIDHGSVHLAVVVQRMVASAVSGVMFTANPVTGKRDQVVIDASPGLGEAVVSGAVNPDHFVVEGADGAGGPDGAVGGEIVERSLGDKRFLICPLAGGGTEKVDIGENHAPCLTDRQILELAELGAKVQAHYGSPQDTEWAIDAWGELHLTQSRPITTLFPVPERADGHDDFHVYFCFSLAQGLERPITPAGLAALREIARAAGRTIVGDPRPDGYIESAGRVFIDLTNVLRSRTGRAFFPRVLDVMEARSAQVLRGLYDDPRLSLTHTSPWPAVKRAARLARRFHAPSTALRALANPEAAVRRARRTETKLLQTAEKKSIEQALRDCVVPVLPTVAPTALVGFAMLALTSKLVRAEPGELQTLLRSLPNNVTTEMDLDLWHLARAIREDRDVVRVFQDDGIEELAARYRDGELPEAAQHGIRAFLNQWGHRAVAEIDLGLPRWSDDPTYVIGVVRNYLRLDDEQAQPDVVFARGAAEAEAMIDRLARRAKGRGRLVRFALHRTRTLAGLREYPKYLAITLFGALRERIAERGAELHAQGRIDAAQDVFFLDFEEMRATHADLRQRVAERKAEYEREMRRRHIPRVLLSDGTEPEVTQHAQATLHAPGDLVGTAASAGEITGHARVVTDPVGAHLEPGEILVTPSTDPGWTPLFLTAGGLVMEMGGANSHGAVVAREYGIPAVVGVRDAVARIQTGDVITVDGSMGVVRTHGKEAAEERGRQESREGSN
ncbi:PEP/pyruvate-binding domain-containing protein [Streptomyces sp. NPDC056982]|uniref:PEP/pyruvate-binding domain-containing protein n=1 Tax=Streptomyces sp. NPDC056982 TaxID=3345986 RepID=UPI003638238E